ncbi:MAG: hypothetical protein ACTSRP_21745 [Candidatus Helarchaeota archaeon]
MKIQWQELAKKGKLEGDLRDELDKFRHDLINKILTNNNCNLINENNVLSENAKELINPKLDDIFLKYNVFSEKEIKLKKKQFYFNLERDLNLILNKEALCSIKFDGYTIYRFFNAISLLLPEVEINVQKDRLYILTIDPLRICLIEIILRNDSYQFFREGKISFNLLDLQNVLKCKNNDNSITELIFGLHKLYIKINSKKFNSIIERELNCIDFHQSEDLNIKPLRNIDYTCQFEISKEKLKYLLENFGIYSDIIELQISPKKIQFIESGELGNNTISWDKNSISKLDIIFNKDQISSNISKYKKANSNKKIKTQFSLSFFNIIYKMASLLDKSDKIFFFLREKFPMVSKIRFPKLEKTLINLYISPRK